MLQQLARLMLAVAVWAFSTGIAQAVSLGKIEVASGLGEPFYAEIPLTVDAGENPAALKVNIASGADYRILEVYRDSALNQIRAEVENDSRGIRVELRSTNPIDAPFFNLVLKVQQDRATHFKKFPIFLDLPKAATVPATAKPLPTVNAVAGVAPAVTSTPVVEAPAAAAPATEETTGFKPFDGWARIGRYGPMVYGDTISTVAERLRVDNRFTRQQVMVALFEKNRKKFDQDNINLIKAGTYLDVPTAAEVNRISTTEAHNLIAEHEKRWKELTKQPRYAAVEEAQRTRYSKRIRIGEQASGAASAPMGADTEQPKTEAQSMKGTSASGASVDSAALAAANQETEKAKAEIEQLNQQNMDLQAKLSESEKKIESLSNQMDATGVAAQQQAKKKLELQVARLQSELDRARDQAQASAEASAGPGWIIWLLGGLVVVLLGAVGFLLRREPKHPAMMDDQAAPGSFDDSAYARQAAAPVEDEVPEIEVEEADVEAAAGSDFSDSTMRISPDEAAQFSDSIPDLTDEDTSEMEAFQEEVEDEPDPNVDYLSEADVYLRYGMDDEAMQQVRMALKQDQYNPEAHIKLAQIQKQKGDIPAFENTISTASGMLAGDSLTQFQDAVAELQAGEADVTSLEDTMPPTDVTELIGADADQSAGDEGVDLEASLSELGDIEFGDVVGGEEPAEQAEMLETEQLEAAPTEEAEMLETEQLEAAPAEEPVAEDLSFDLSQLDVGSEEGESTEAPAVSEEMTAGGTGLDFDLSDVEMPESPESEKPEPREEGPEVSTADLDKTVAIDWSQDTSIDSGEMQISGESGAEDMFASESAEAVQEEPAQAEEEPVQAAPEVEPEAVEDLDFDLSTLDEETASVAEADEPTFEVEPEVHVAEPDDSVTTLDLDAGDLDAGLDLSEIEVEAADDFTSTIRTSLDDVEASDVDFTATGEHNLQADAVSFDETPAVASEEDDALLNLDFDSGDQDATQQLEDLLSEFTDEDDDKKKD